MNSLSAKTTETQGYALINGLKMYYEIEHGMLPSMSRPSNPYDNATCESFLKTLKREEIHASTYRDFEVLRERMEEFIERYYNVCRLHSALDYRSPVQFERTLVTRTEPQTARISA